MVTEMTDLERIKELVSILNKAGKSYYSEGVEIMSNFEYDKLYDELVKLEEKTKIVLSDSPTVNVGYETLSELPKERHDSPMLSLDKTKNSDELVDWLGSQRGLLSWKLDGLTIVLTYENGELLKAVTRGNGEVGEIITQNAKVFKNVPLLIPFKGRLVIRGEAIITYSDFEKINEKIPEIDAKYKNPRNLCSGSVRQLNNKITEERNVRFFAFSLVYADGQDFKNSRKVQFEWLKEQGFSVVEYKEVTSENLKDTIMWFEDKIKDNDFPSDGLVILYDDIAYGDSLGRTAKFPRNSMAFKWTDETAVTHLRKIEWSASRTGLINPIAVFDTVELEGTKVSRASVHNISIMEGLQLGIGDEISVFKANMIIPQIADNFTRSGNVEIPLECPVCKGKTQIKQINDVKSLYCMNEECDSKKIEKLIHFASREAMNIDGLGDKIIEQFYNLGFVTCIEDIYHLDVHEKEIMDIEGFGKKSMDKLLEAIENSKANSLEKLLFGLGIKGIGAKMADTLAYHFGSMDALLNANYVQLTSIKDVGDTIASSLAAFKRNERNLELIAHLKELGLNMDYLKVRDTGDNPFRDKTVVITGTLTLMTRKQIKDYLTSQGANVTGSVSKKTD